MNKTFRIDSRMTVGKLKEEFKKEFGGYLRVKEDGFHVADDSTMLGSIGVRSGSVTFTEKTTVKEFENAVHNQCNLCVRIFTKDAWVAVIAEVPLVEVVNIPCCSTIDKMHQFLEILYEEEDKEEDHDVDNEEDKKEDNRKGLPADYKICVEELLQYNERWDKSETMEDYRAQESALDLLFHKIFPENKCLDHILLKIVSLNDFYSTNIYDVYSVARHFIDIKDLDDKINNGEIGFVDKLADVAMKNGRNFHLISFATKYCSHHNPNAYPIYDRYVCDVLRALRNRDNFSEFKNDDLKKFETFKKVIDDCIGFYKLIDPSTGKPFTYKQVDRYLWLLGKDYFNAYDN